MSDKSTEHFAYFDYAAATPLEPRVLAAMQPFWSERFFNPSATYAPAREVAVALEQARTRVAFWLGARPAEVIFTAGGTEANNLAIHGVMRHVGDVSANVVVSAIEHDAVLRPAAGYDWRSVVPAADGVIDPGAVQAAIDDHTVLVSIMYANNEVGTIQPIAKVAQHVKELRADRLRRGINRPLYLHTDACQAANYLDLHAARLGVDLMTLNGGKIYGPKQSGVLYVRGGIELAPLLQGGGQEGGIRSGTENVAACIGLAAALDIVQEDRQTEVARLQKMQQQFITDITAKLPGVIINGSLKKRLPNNVHLTLPDTDNERVLLQLEAKGVLAAAGSACSASSQEPSHVLRAMGISDADAQASLRFTMGRQTSEADVHRAVSALVAIAKTS
jgi:cysteine desulfurase